MIDIQFRLSMPPTSSLDAVVDAMSTVQRAASLLPVHNVSRLRLLSQDEIVAAVVSGDPDLGMALSGLEHRLGIRFDRGGVPRLVRGQTDKRTITVLPRRIVGFTAEPGFESDRLDVFLTEFPASIRIAGRGSAVRRQMDLLTGLAGWTHESCCLTAGRDSSLIDALMSHLNVIAMLDAAGDLGVEVEVADATGFWDHRRLSDLITAYHRIGSPSWTDHAEHLESVRNLADLTKAADPESLPTGSPP